MARFVTRTDSGRNPDERSGGTDGDDDAMSSSSIWCTGTTSLPPLIPPLPIPPPPPPPSPQPNPWRQHPHEGSEGDGDDGVIGLNGVGGSGGRCVDVVRVVAVPCRKTGGGGGLPFPGLMSMGGGGAIFGLERAALRTDADEAAADGSAAMAETETPLP